MQKCPPGSGPGGCLHPRPHGVPFPSIPPIEERPFPPLPPSARVFSTHEAWRGGPARNEVSDQLSSSTLQGAGVLLVRVGRTFAFALSLSALRSRCRCRHLLYLYCTTPQVLTSACLCPGHLQKAASEKSKARRGILCRLIIETAPDPLSLFLSCRSMAPPPIQQISDPSFAERVACGGGESALH